MRSTVFAIIAVGAAASAAHAGGPAFIEAEPQPVVAAPVAAHDWSGFYAGVSYGSVRGDLTYPGFTSYDLTSGNARGIFLGHLWQRQNIVYGAELSYMKTSGVTLEGFPREPIDDIIDLKAKVGYAANRFLVYGLAGYSRADHDFELFPTDSYTGDGLSLGVGFDFAATDRISVGLEYLSRDLKGSAGGTTDAEPGVNTLSLRVGFSF